MWFNFVFFSTMKTHLVLRSPHGQMVLMKHKTQTFLHTFVYFWTTALTIGLLKRNWTTIIITQSLLPFKLSPYRFVFHTYPRFILPFEKRSTRNSSQTCSSVDCSDLLIHHSFVPFLNLPHEKQFFLLLAVEKAML